MMITLLDKHNKNVAINVAHIMTIYEDPIIHTRVVIEMIDKSQITIPHMTVEEIVAKINVENNIDKLGKMTDAICNRIQHLEEQMVAGLQYVGRSCH